MDYLTPVVELHNEALSWTSEHAKPLLEILLDYEIAVISPMDLAEYIHYTVAALLVTILIVACMCRPKGKRKQKGSAVLLWGPVGAGKTALFGQLREGVRPKTITSMTWNEDVVTIGNKKFTVIDFPGHQRLRSDLMSNHLHKAGKVVFVLNASTLKHELPRVAQQLYDLLTRAFVAESAVPVIVACNKTDDPTAVTADAARKLLEAELNKIRTTRSANPGVAGSLDDDSDSVSIGIVGKPFKFEDLEHDIEFVGCSCFRGDLDALKSLITDL